MTIRLRWDDPVIDPTTRRNYRPDPAGRDPLPARWRGTCCECHQLFEVGDLIQLVVRRGPKVEQRNVYRHYLAREVHHHIPLTA